MGKRLINRMDKILLMITLITVQASQPTVGDDIYAPPTLTLPNELTYNFKCNSNRDIHISIDLWIFNDNRSADMNEIEMSINDIIFNKEHAHTQDNSHDSSLNIITTKEFYVTMGTEYVLTIKNTNHQSPSYIYIHDVTLNSNGHCTIDYVDQKEIGQFTLLNENQIKIFTDEMQPETTINIDTTKTKNTQND